VLATTNGRAFTKVATLPVPVRYAAVAGAGNRIWGVRRLDPAGNSSVIQQVNVVTGKARVAGRMPAPISAATAVTLGGRIFIAGGQVTEGGGALIASRKVLAYDPAPAPGDDGRQAPGRSHNAAAAVISGTAFLVGGKQWSAAGDHGGAAAPGGRLTQPRRWPAAQRGYVPNRTSLGTMRTPSGTSEGSQIINALVWLWG